MTASLCSLASAARCPGLTAAAVPFEQVCALHYTLTRLPRDRWEITAHEPPEGVTCGGMNATVEGTYSRGRR